MAVFVYVLKNDDFHILTEIQDPTPSPKDRTTKNIPWIFPGTPTPTKKHPSYGTKTNNKNNENTITKDKGECIKLKLL